MRIIVKVQQGKVTIVNAGNGNQIGIPLEEAAARAWLTEHHAAYAGPRIEAGKGLEGLYDVPDEVEGAQAQGQYPALAPLAGREGWLLVELPQAGLLSARQRALAISCLQQKAADGRVYSGGNWEAGEYSLAAFVAEGVRALLLAGALEVLLVDQEHASPSRAARVTVEFARGWKHAHRERVTVITCPECGQPALCETFGSAPLPALMEDGAPAGGAFWPDAEWTEGSGVSCACVSCGWRDVQERGDGDQAERVGGGHFDLACLVCGATLAELAQRNRSDLVAMQEHLMEAHGFSQRDLERSSRHKEPGAGGEECFEWSLPVGSPLASSLNLQEGRYMRACRVEKGNGRGTSTATLVCIATIEELRCLADHTLGLPPLAVTIQLDAGRTRIQHLQTVDRLPESDQNWWWVEQPAGGENWYTDGEVLTLTDIGRALAQGTLFVEAQDAAARRAAACATARAYHLWCNTCLRDYYVPVAQGFSCPKDEEHDAGVIEEG